MRIVILSGSFGPAIKEDSRGCDASCRICAKRVRNMTARHGRRRSYVTITVATSLSKSRPRARIRPARSAATL